MTNFELSRNIFFLLSKHLDRNPNIKKELEEVIRVLLTQFNTTIPENRFTVGGALEHFVIAVLNTIPGLHAVHTGEISRRSDIKIIYKKEDTLISIKGIFSGAGTNLVNTRGSSNSIRWEESTLFFVSGMGLYYGDPKIIPKKEIRVTADALVIGVLSLEKLRKRNKAFFYPLKIPQKFEQVSLDKSRVASRELAAQIIKSSCKILKL